MHGETLTESQLIKRYQDIANCYRKLEDFENAQKFISMAIEKISSTDNLDSSQVYFTAADIYFDIKNFEKALTYAKKSLEIVKNSMPEDFSSLSTNYMHVGNLSYSAGKLEDTVENYRLAEQFQSKCTHPDFNMIRFLQFRIANVLTELKNFDEAEKIFAELLEDLSKFYTEDHPEFIHIKSLLQEVRRQKEK
jgi:tetratricopeptide (TPR) repeat protein